MADIAMGFVFVHDAHTAGANWPVLVLLIAASSLIYTAGMILNDVYDLEIDRQERPFRPLPSGQIGLQVATRMGYLFLIGGVLLAASAGWLEPDNQVSPWRSGIVAVVLALAVLAYDAWLKKTPLGPLGMGLCRLLNVLLGMSAAGAVAADPSWLTYPVSSWMIASGLGLYITGVTWFARSEARDSSRPQLVLATLVIIAGIVLLAQFQQWPPSGKAKELLRNANLAWLLFAVLALPMARRALMAISNPDPANVQAMVKHCILSLIMLDAAIALLSSGPVAGLLIAALLVPSFLLGRWVYST
jgi:4-hydroxybenzoate polyprenyltransferase